MRIYDTGRVQGVPYPHEIPYTEVDQKKLDELHGASVFVPSGGTAGDLLRKKTSQDYDFEWVNAQSYDGTLNASNQPANAVPLADGSGHWSWQIINPEVTVDWNAINNKPTFGTAAYEDAADFAAHEHQHDAADVTSGVFSSAFVPKVLGLRGISYGTAAPSGGVDGDIYIQYTV